MEVLPKLIHEIRFDDLPGKDAAARVLDGMQRRRRRGRGRNLPRLTSPATHTFCARSREREIHRACENDEETVSDGPDGDSWNGARMNRHSARGGAAENPSMPNSGATTSDYGRPTNYQSLWRFFREVRHIWQKGAQSAHSRKRDDLGEICSHLTETPIVATA